MIRTTIGLFGWALFVLSGNARGEETSEASATEKPKLGLITSYEMAGTPPGSQPWQILSHLERHCTVKSIPMNADKIDGNIDALLVVHPAAISDEAQFAIDQYLLGGGRVIAMLDPFSLYNRQAAAKLERTQEKAAQNHPVCSTMDKLLKAWGVQFESVNVVADRRFVNRRRPNPIFLGIPAKGISNENAATEQIDYIEMIFAGAFYGDAVSGLTKDVLVSSSEDAGTLSPHTLFGDPAAAQAALNRMQSSGKPLELVIQLRGNFETAFPDGLPEHGGSTRLKVSQESGTVTLIADTDMVTDENGAQVARMPGGQTLEFPPPNKNLAFVLSLVGFPGERAEENPMMGESIAALKKIGGTFTSGKSLILEGSKVTDAGLVHLEGLTGLKRLMIHSTRITDEGLEHLTKLTELETLDLIGTKVTDAGVENLQAALPKCKINQSPD